MNFILFGFISVVLRISDGFVVRGQLRPLVAPLGSSVILPCYADELLPEEGLMVEWTRTDSNNLVHLFINGASRAEEQHQDYHDRAHFITEEIQHGIFSLGLDDLRAGDEGLYRCKVYSQQDSGETFVEIKAVEYLSVSGSAHSVSASVGEDVTLNCSVDSHIAPEEIERVSWRKTENSENIQLLVFEKNTVIPADTKRYRDRVELFTSEIPKGNFSLRLKSVRTEDRGVYLCLVKTGGVSANTTIIIEQLGFSVLHKLILFLCVSASGSALLLSFLSHRLQQDCTVKRLQYCLIFLPNIMMFIALILWGVFDGFPHETIACSALFLLRPYMLFRAGPHGSQVVMKRWMNYGLWSFVEYMVFTGIVYSGVLFKLALVKSFNFARLGYFAARFSVIHLLLALIVLLMECFPGWKNCVAIRSMFHNYLDSVPCLILILFYGMVIFKVQGLFGNGLFSLFLTMKRASGINFERCFPQLTNRNQLSGSCLTEKKLFISDVIMVNIVMILFYYFILEEHEDCMGWACVIGFQQIKWALMHFSWLQNDSVGHHSGVLYKFGSVGVVLLSSSFLMMDLILKILNGERAVGDLRIILFPSESLFALSLLILQVLTPGEVHGYMGCYTPAVFIIVSMYVGVFICTMIALIQSKAE